jgi:hypothetical protein
MPPGDWTAKDDLVFGNRDGKPLRESKLLRNVLRPAAERAGLGRVKWHQFGQASPAKPSIH